MSPIPLTLFLLAMMTTAAVAQTVSQEAAPQPSRPAAQTLPDAPSSTLQPVQEQTEKMKVRGTPTLADPYAPLTGQQKFSRWIHTTYSPYTFGSAAISAGWAQATDTWPGYGGGMEGYGKRFGASLADAESSAFFKVFLLPTLLHQDPRYFAMRKGGVWRRAAYAGTRIVVTRKDDGTWGFNTSEVVGTMFVHSLQNAYVPERNRGLGDTLSSAGGAFLSDAISNTLREFWPDISRVFHKHEPRTLKKIEEKVPKGATAVITGGEQQ